MQPTSDPDVPQVAPQTGKAKPGRTRAACIGCRSNKQRCDGAQRHPCRRCELYCIPCEYENGAPPKTAVEVAVAGHDPARTGLSAAKIPPFTPATGTEGMAQALAEMNARLERIELGLEQDRHRPAFTRAHPSAHSPLHDPTPPHTATALSQSPASLPASYGPAPLDPSLADLPLNADVKPVGLVPDPLEQLVGIAPAASWPTVAEVGAGGAAAGAAGSGGVGAAVAPRGMPETPAAIALGIVSAEEARAVFVNFNENVQPQLSLGEVDALDPDNVYTRCPFLHDVVLLIHYNALSTPQAQEATRGLSEIVNNHLTTRLLPRFLVSDPTQANADLIRAIVLLMYHMPAQYASLLYSLCAIKP